MIFNNNNETARLLHDGQFFNALIIRKEEKRIHTHDSIITEYYITIVSNEVFDLDMSLPFDVSSKGLPPNLKEWYVHGLELKNDTTEIILVTKSVEMLDLRGGNWS